MTDPAKLVPVWAQDLLCRAYEERCVRDVLPKLAEQLGREPLDIVENTYAWGEPARLEVLAKMQRHLSIVGGAT